MFFVFYIMKPYVVSYEENASLSMAVDGEKVRASTRSTNSERALIYIANRTSPAYSWHSIVTPSNVRDSILFVKFGITPLERSNFKTKSKLDGCLGGDPEN